MICQRIDLKIFTDQRSASQVTKAMRTMGEVRLMMTPLLTRPSGFCGLLWAFVQAVVMLLYIFEFLIIQLCAFLKMKVFS